MIEIKKDVLIAPFTMYQIGGPAQFFAEVKTKEELIEALEFAKHEHVPFFILGAGSNILVSDEGFRGLIIRMTGENVVVEGNRVIVDAGAKMPRVASETLRAGLVGFEWAVGIPGTIGGSVFGNAGCFGGETAQVVEQIQLLEFPIVRQAHHPEQSRRISNFPGLARAWPRAGQFPNKSQILNDKFQIRELLNQECKFEYRGSIFKQHPEWLIISVTLRLQKGDEKEMEEAKARLKEMSLYRVREQDIGTKNAGSMFKGIPITDEVLETLRSHGDYWRRGHPYSSWIFENRRGLMSAGFLIDMAGCKGKRVGNVSVSRKHANFFINEGGATAEEVRELILQVKAEVKEKYEILLEEEIRLVGFGN